MVWKSIKCVDQINTENSFEKCCMVVQTKNVIWLFSPIAVFLTSTWEFFKIRKTSYNLTKGKGAERRVCEFFPY